MEEVEGKSRDEVLTLAGRREYRELSGVKLKQVWSLIGLDAERGSG